MQLEFDYSKLRGKIHERFHDIRDFTRALGTSETTVHKLLGNKQQFNQRTIWAWCNVLNIPLKESAPYFFTLKV